MILELSTQELAEKAALSEVVIDGEVFFKISHVDYLRPFLMNVVSDTNLWIFVSSNGGITAGRKNAEFALFPYETDDRLTASAEITGAKTIVQIHHEGETTVWEPFSIRQTGKFRVERNLYKSIYNNKLIFEEINLDEQLGFRYQWATADAYGLVRSAYLENLSEASRKITICDGLQNLLPAGVPSDLQRSTSNLVDAYRRSELVEEVGLGILALSAIIVDKAEPSEALKANAVFAIGVENATYLLSTKQLDAFRLGNAVEQEIDVKGEKSAFFVCQSLNLSPRATQAWQMVADVNLSHGQIARRIQALQNGSITTTDLQNEIASGTEKLKGLIGVADGFQCTASPLHDARHYSNVLFNIMRGGVFDDGYCVEKKYFEGYLHNANHRLSAKFSDQIKLLPDSILYGALKDWAKSLADPDLIRLTIEYLPLKFSRRHGDPSRPWNRFTINTRDEQTGDKILDYEGNWRDIFQNWEALAHSFPQFIEGMIFKFLNASTFDGYNPYRVTKDGFDWETIEPDDPWSYIGYWGDHQIIYLLKFLEFAEAHFPKMLSAYFDESVFVYANVPYRIKSYADILKNPKDTIDFAHESDLAIRNNRVEHGADGALIMLQNAELYRVNLVEKLLATVLAKLSNWIPDGGIWMNTQRPEWNDANNALVGNGVSMVTLYYLRRFLKFFGNVLGHSSASTLALSAELARFFEETHHVFADLAASPAPRTDASRRKVMDALGTAASNYRERVYEKGFSGEQHNVEISQIQDLLQNAQQQLELCIAANRRADGLYHAYNLLTVTEGESKIGHLSEMLEGQVAVLASGYLSTSEGLAVLEAMRNSALYRADQEGYLLYPNKNLKGFLSKNTLPEDAVSKSSLLSLLVERGDGKIVERDVFGKDHFNGNFRNAADLEKALSKLAENGLAKLVDAEKAQILGLFEQVFDHKSFTGRSGTFYGYEGLGSIYWHMVSKMLLSVQEMIFEGLSHGKTESVQLFAHFDAILAGIGADKSPTQYGAFPTDAYSHTPAGKGVQQPGMTGQVKEDIISRLGGLGVFVQNGCLQFYPKFVPKSAFLKQETPFEFIDLEGDYQKVTLQANSLAFTYCQTPVYYLLSTEAGLSLYHKNGEITHHSDWQLDASNSQSIFARKGEILKIEVKVRAQDLRD